MPRFQGDKRKKRLRQYRARERKRYIRDGFVSMAYFLKRTTPWQARMLAIYTQEIPEWKWFEESGRVAPDSPAG